MKRFFLLLSLFLLTYLSSKAIDVNSVPVGLTIDSTVVMAESQSFGRRIEGTVITPNLDYLLLKFRETTKSGKWLKFKGEIGAFCLKESRLLWTRPFNYGTSSVVCTKAGVLIHQNNNKVTMLDPKTGEERWKRKFYPILSDDTANIVLAYSSATSSKLSGYDLTTGQQLWTVKLPHDKNWGWNHVISEDSVRWLIVADNLNRLNIHTGELYTYEAKTGVVDVKNAILQGLAMAVGAAAGGMIGGGAYVYPYPMGTIGKNVINQLHSNVLIDDSLYFFSDRQHVVCLNDSMHTLWSYELPSKTAASARLICNDSTLYMFNLGYGVKEGMYKKMGRPFIAAFDKRTGACRLMNMLSMRKDIVEDAALTPDGVFMLFDDGLSYKKELDDSTVTVSSWDVKSYGRLRAIITTPVYTYYKLKSMFDIVASDGFHFPIITENGDVFLVDKELHISERFPAHTLYHPICMVGNSMCVYSPFCDQQDIWLVSFQGIPEIRMTVPIHNIGIADRKLYLSNSNSLYYLPLEQSELTK